MLDYKELPNDGIRFEQLVREMLIRTGLEVHWTGVGPDAGRDLVATEIVPGPLSRLSRKWLVSCKHKAHGGGSVGIEDVRDITDACRAVDATGFLLACSTQPSAAVVRRLEELQANNNLATAFWDGVEIEKRLNVPELFPLIHQFFPKTGRDQPWKIYNAGAPSFWAANFKDYFLYLSSRIANGFPDLDEVAFIASKLEAIPLPKDHMIRLRAVYYDDKHEQFVVFADYLFPTGKARKVIPPKALNKVLRSGDGLHRDGQMSWYTTFWDIRYEEESMLSDRFHPDAKHFYEPFLSNYRTGCNRDGWIDEIHAPLEIETATLE